VNTTSIKGATQVAVTDFGKVIPNFKRGIGLYPQNGSRMYRRTTRGDRYGIRAMMEPNASRPTDQNSCLTFLQLAHMTPQLNTAVRALRAVYGPIIAANIAKLPELVRKP
jgi:hypothetical protein